MLAMSITFFRTGLWIVFSVLALYVVRETYLGTTATFLTDRLLNDLGLVGLGAIALGVVAWILEKLTPKKKGHCRVCRRPVPAGEFYCRLHLRDVLERSRDDVHPTRLR